MKTPFQSHNDAHSRPQARAPLGARLAGGSAGLVSLKTSDTPDLSEVPIDQVQARITRLRRSVTVGARLIQDSVGWLGFKPAMLTLTYRDIDGFKPLHISVLIKHIRQWLARRGHVLRYVWVAELQMRGALHYHVVTWLPRGLTLPKPDKQGWWTLLPTPLRTMTHHENADTGGGGCLLEDAPGGSAETGQDGRDTRRKSGSCVGIHRRGPSRVPSIHVREVLAIAARKAE